MARFSRVYHSERTVICPVGADQSEAVNRMSGLYTNRWRTNVQVFKGKEYKCFTQHEIWTSKEDYSTLIYFFEGENPAPTETQSGKTTTKTSTEEKVTETTGDVSGDK